LIFDAKNKESERIVDCGGIELGGTGIKCAIGKKKINKQNQVVHISIKDEDILFLETKDPESSV
jgi:hypothetical protein